MSNIPIAAVMFLSPPQCILSTGGTLCDLGVTCVGGTMTDPNDPTTFAATTLPVTALASQALGGAPLPASATVDTLYTTLILAVQAVLGVQFIANGGNCLLWDAFAVLA